MRCTGVQERINHLSSRDELASHPELAAHAGSCQACGQVLRRHLSLIALLREADTAPGPADFAARVLSRLDERRAVPVPAWRWAAVAACALAALALGFYFGQFSSGTAQANDSMASTYQAAFTGQTANSAELAYLEAGTRAAATVPVRSAP